MDREAWLAEWLAERRTGIGSTDAPAILGMYPPSFGRTALHVWLEKIDQRPERAPTEAMRWGLLHEPAIAAEYERRAGIKVWEPAKRIARHPERDWQIASIDRVAADRIVPLKTVNAYAYRSDEWGEEFTDQIPEHYLVEAQHQLAVAGCERADVATLIGGCALRIYTVRRNQDLIDALTRAEEEFWGRVQRRDPPPPDWRHHVSTDAIRLLFGLHKETIQLGNDVLHLAQEYQEQGAAEKAAHAFREQAKAQLLWHMQGASCAELPDGSRLTQQKVDRHAYTVPDGSYILFRIKQPKE